jgi:hypothetical protein
MYSEKLEKLIELALADGVLTEKEKQLLMKVAQAEGVDLDEFEMVLEARLYEKTEKIPTGVTSNSLQQTIPQRKKLPTAINTKVKNKVEQEAKGCWSEIVKIPGDVAMGCLSGCLPTWMRGCFSIIVFIVIIAATVLYIM